MKTIVKSQLPVLALEIDEEGTVAQKSMQMTRQGQLENTLLDALYPGIRVATVEIPGTELDEYGRAKVEQALATFRVGGVEYRLIGASGSAKNGKYYAVNKEFEKPIAERFQQWPEAAITYFGILISPCKVRIEEPDVRVLVVDDHTLGTNDCRGWIRRSMFEKLDLPARHFYQFRLAFNRTQAKGSFKVMENDVADAHRRRHHPAQKLHEACVTGKVSVSEALFRRRAVVPGPSSCWESGRSRGNWSTSRATRC